MRISGDTDRKRSKHCGKADIHVVILVHVGATKIAVQVTHCNRFELLRLPPTA